MHGTNSTLLPLIVTDDIVMRMPILGHNNALCSAIMCLLKHLYCDMQPHDTGNVTR